MGEKSSFLGIWQPAAGWESSCGLGHLGGKVWRWGARGDELKEGGKEQKICFSAFGDVV